MTVACADRVTETMACEALWAVYICAEWTLDTLSQPRIRHTCPTRPSHESNIWIRGAFSNIEPTLDFTNTE